MKRSLIVGSGILLGFAGMGTALVSAAEQKRLIDTSAATIADLGPAASDAVGAELLGRIEAKWGRAMRNAYGWTEASFEQFRAYRNYPSSVLEEALAAPTFERMQSVLDAFATLQARETMAKAFPARTSFALNATTPEMASNDQVMAAKLAVAKALGEDGRDLVFIPVTPCTVWDSRFATDPPAAGIIANGVTKTFYSHYSGAGGSYAAWGGNPSCPETAQNSIGGRPYAVMMTVYINDATANGWLTFYRNGDPDPSQATISVYYSPGPTRTQTVISKSNRGYGTGPDYDIAVTGRFASAHGAASVTGYFIKPGATALQCATQSTFGGNVAWANGTTAEISLPACNTGYTMTGVMCGYNATAPVGVSLRETGSYGYCEWMNGSGGALNYNILDASTICCRVPGR